MRLHSPTLLLAVVLVACGADAPLLPALPTSPPPGASPTASVAPGPPPPDASPTERNADQRARDDARAPLAKALTDAFSNFAPTLSRDRTKLLFGSRRDGNREFYLSDVASPSAAPVLLTGRSDRAGGARFSRDGRSVLFTRDTGADENYRIYRVGLDGKDETCLTPGPTLRRSLPYEPRKKPGTLVYGQRDVKSPSTEIVVQLPRGAARVVATDPGPVNVEDVTDDGRHALVSRRSSSSDNTLLELDLASGKTRRLYPEEGKKAVVNEARYSPDGKRAYVAADDGGDGQFLFALDIASGAVRQRYRQRIRRRRRSLALPCRHVAIGWRSRSTRGTVARRGSWTRER